MNRRNFLGAAGVAASGTTLAVLTAGMARFVKPRVQPDASTLVRLGKLEDIAVGAVRLLPKHHIQIVATERGIAAISMLCTHLGCVIRETPGGFQCPCHGAKYDADGNVLEGPALRPLRWLALSRAADGSLLADTADEVEPGTYLPLILPTPENI